MDDRHSLAAELSGAKAELEALRAENQRLRRMLGLTDGRPAAPDQLGGGRLFAPEPTGPVTRRSPPEDKLALFRSLFGHRTDTFAMRWENRSDHSGWSPARRGRDGPLRELTDQVLSQHLEGRLHAGIYPLLRGDMCGLLACDFDGETWALDAGAYLDAARECGLDPALELSRSGKGAHVWLFFERPLPAVSPRRLGIGLLHRAMERRVEIDLASYDRLFPSQDALPSRGFGNLIALPLQGDCRRRGTTVFLDPATLEPWDDQWAALSRFRRSDQGEVERLAAELDPFRAPTPRPSAGPPPPGEIRAELAAGIAIDRTAIPAWLVAQLKHAASLPNPEFFERQRLRFSTWNTPRVIRCYQETLTALELPRGLVDEAERIITTAGSRLELTDRRPEPAPIDVSFRGELRWAQQVAVDAVAGHEHGVLVAPPGTGKTVIGCALIARHQVPTLVLVDRRPLADQWRDRLAEFLGLSGREVGQIGGGRNRLTGVVDIATLQSLARRPEVTTEFFSRYGLVIVDECHHAPATSYEPILRNAVTRRWLGLTATPFRADRLDPLIGFWCGPVRHTVELEETPTFELERHLHVRPTTFRPADPEQLSIQELFRALSEDDERNRLIATDVVLAARAGRRVLVLSQRKDQLVRLAQLLEEEHLDPLILVGGQGRKASQGAIVELGRRASAGPVVALATGSYVGEGFDLPGLDTLVLAFPLAFKGRIIQYVGRLLRPDPAKTDIQVHDYVDVDVPVLVSMHRKRLPTYRELGLPAPTGPRGGAPTAPDSGEGF